MSSELQVQSEVFENIKTICNNYKKDSASRKTSDYLTKRLLSLESHWNDFDARNNILVKSEDKSHEYFEGEVYVRTKKMYEDLKQDILSRLQSALPGSPGVYKLYPPEADKPRSRPSSALSQTAESVKETTANEHLTRLIGIQSRNFRAMQRAMAKVDIGRRCERWELEEQLSTLRSKWTDIDKLHWELDGECDSSYYLSFEDIEQRYESLKRQINNQLSSNLHYQQSAPKIDVPVFSGNYAQWITFKDLFLEVVDKNPSLSKVQKMQHLKSKLRDEAENLVRHLHIISDNYESCWEILSQRYDNRRLLFTSLVNTMLNIPSVQQANASNLKKLHDVINECLNGLQNIGMDTESWSPLIAHLMAQKLDTNTYSEYTKDLQNPRDVPNVGELTAFLESKFMALETLSNRQKDVSTGASSGSQQKSSVTSNSPSNKTAFKPKRFHFSKTYHVMFGQCPLCDQSHVLMQCRKFIKMNTEERNATITKLNMQGGKLCKNCLYSHGSEQCSSQKTCRECNQQHHTLLHNAKKTSPKSKMTLPGPSSSNAQNLTTHHAAFNALEILLTTTLVQVKAFNGEYITLRALLDQGSQANLISESAAQLLKLPRKRVTATVSGVGSISGDCRGCLHLECKSINSDFTFTSDVLIMKQLTNPLPNKTFERPDWEHLANLKLADPEFNVSRGIDLLLGADVYSNVIMSGVLKGDAQSPTAQQTKLGWILCGNAGNIETLRCHVTLTDLSEISRFWETEDILTNDHDVTDEDYCEKYYQETTTRTADGKYIVKMPMLDNFEENLGKSKTIAISQYLQLERRLCKNDLLASRYNDFINEYNNLGHMTPSVSNNKTECFLPHHGVLREQSTTTKLRVVFNASQKTSKGYSLNDLMHKGPNLQKDIQELLIQWRSYKYVFTADIEKHYRSIWLSEDQHSLQKIIWRGSDNKLQEMDLRTVTYGTRCAPWLAMRTLRQLAEDDGHNYPEAASVLNHHFYVDDLISGHNSLEAAKRIKDDLIKLLNGGGMNLRKWCSNNHSILENLSQDQISTSKTVDFKTEDTSRTLGLSWSPQTDTFKLNWDTEAGKRLNLTKSELLSQISKLYDPLGWFSPVTVAAKLIFQQVWEKKTVTWGDVLPDQIQEQWDKIKTELPRLHDVKLNRWIGTTYDQIELHGFCDASERAYACVIYSRIKDSKGRPTSTLIAAKTRVAPLSEKITLPRLELSGALLLSQLIEKSLTALKDIRENITVHLHCDSQVVLAWLQGGPTKWEKYVANRVAKIIKVAPANIWNYVKSEENPADCASRGLPPRKLVNFDLWWQGPEFLKTFEKRAPRCYTTTLEENAITSTFTVTQNIATNDVIDMLLENCSVFTRAVRVIAWVLRFVDRTRGKRPETLYLSSTEMKQSADRIVRNVQQTQFKEDYNQLRKDKTVSQKSKIFKLLPYLDESGLLRVKGRLKHSDLPLNMKNPMILPHSGKLTQLIVEHAHAMTLHGGARLTLAYIRQKYWIISGNRAVKTLLRRCVICHRYNHTENHQLMGDLPRPRVTPSRPFTHTGIDYTGHVEIKINKGRGVKTSKGYVVIFICLATKAVHIELASDLSTDTFLAAFERLCARRGTPKHVYTDNGTNFVGAARVLRSEFEQFKQLLTVEFFDNISKMGISWHFSVPTWASANGIWEAAVKSMKRHLTRIIHGQKLTFEEFATLLSKIEACLNSRYICPLTEDPDEFYNGLTPGHFLTGSPTMLVPESDYVDDASLDLRKRWQLVKHMSHRFWKIWSSDYLHQLQIRSKWNTPTRNLQEGDVVLMKEDNLPPGKWALARVIQLHPGSDGLVRVATLKTREKTMKRPITKLAPLPINEDEKRVFHLQKQTGQENTSGPSASSPAKSAKKMSTCGFINIVLLTLFLLSNTASVECKRDNIATNITSLGRERPIYYDPHGRVALIHDEWILVMYYNLTSYWEGTRQMERYLLHLEDVCKSLEPTYCKLTLTQLNHEMGLLNYYNDILLEPSKHLSRKRRGLVDGVGYVANALFGILDQSFATKYENDIQAIQDNEGHLLSLIKNQTSIIQLQNEALKRNEENMDRQFQIINSFLERVNTSLAETQSFLEATMATTYFSTSSLTASLLLNNLRTVQELLFNTLTDIYKGRIDIHLLTPANLIKQLETISSQLPRTLTLPIENIRNEIKDVYKLLFVRGRITNGFFIFEVHIPLLCDETFKLFKVIPLPILTQTNHANWVQTSAEYIAINFRKSTYLSMTQRNVDQCTRQSADSLICHATLPVYNLHDNNGTPCEAKLIGQHPTSPCVVKMADCADDWIDLQTPNTWLAVCCGECTIRTLCNNELILHTLQGSSIVTLASGCVLQTASLIIYSQSRHYSNVTMDPGFIAPTEGFNTSINAIVSANIRALGSPTQLLYKPDHSHLMEIDDKLRFQTESEDKPLTTTSISDGGVHYIIMYSLFGASALALIVWLARTLGRGRCSARARPAAPPPACRDIEMQQVQAKRQGNGADNISFNFE